MSLKQIRGIGAVKQSWLRQVLNIRSISDLAVADADRMADRLQDAGHLISASEISGWITQAQILFQDDPNDSDSTSDRISPDRISLDSIPANTTAEMPIAAPWQTIATLTLDYQTRQVGDRTEDRTIARHHTQETASSGSPENPAERQTDSTLCQEDVVEWVREQLREWELAPLESASNTVSNIATEVALEIAPEIASNPASVMLELTHLQSQQPIVRSQPFTLEATLQIVGIGAIDLTLNEINYVVQIELRDRSSGAIWALETSPQALISEQLNYQVVCPSITLPSGLYRVLVQVKIPGLSPGFLKVPLLPIA